MKSIKKDWPYVEVSGEYMEIIILFELLYVLEIRIVSYH